MCAGCANIPMATEFELIERFFAAHIEDPAVRTGIGDDAAVISPPPGMDLVITTDTLVEGVHFPQQSPPHTIGHKALAVNLSDLASMGAQPKWVTLALTLPSADESWLAAFSEGFLRLAAEHEVALVGGDTTTGPLSITVQAIGVLPTGTAITRDGANDGDAIYMTGHPGDAGFALAAMQGRYPVTGDLFERCRQRLEQPIPRIAAGKALRGLASAAIDISDGLLSDLGHLLQVSRVGAEIKLESLPLSDCLIGAMEGRIDWLIPLTAGDDYELLFTISCDKCAELGNLDPGCPVTRIGTVTASPGLRCTHDGQSVALPQSLGYEHFADD